MKKYLNIAVIICLIVVGLSGCNEKQEENTIKIAYNIPLTGHFSIYGESIRDGALLAIDDLKDSLQKYDLNFVFDIQDNQSTAKNAQMALKKQLLNTPDVYVAGIAQPLYSILDAIEADNIPCFAWGFEEYILKDYNNTFRTWVNLDAEANNYINYIKKTSPRKVMLIRPQTVGCQLQYDNIIIPFLKNNNIDYVVEVFNNDQKDFKAIILKCKKEKADLYIVNGFDFHIIEMEKEFRANNLIKENNVYWSLDFLDAANKMNCELLEGMRVTAPLFLIKQNIEWNNRFSQKFNREPRYTDAYAYDMIHVLFNVCKNKIPQNIDEWTKAINKIKFHGITGTISFNKKRDLEYNLKTCIYRDNILVIE